MAEARTLAEELAELATLLQRTGDAYKPLGVGIGAESEAREIEARGLTGICTHAAKIVARAADALTWRAGPPPEGEAVVCCWPEGSSVFGHGPELGRRHHDTIHNANGTLEVDWFNCADGRGGIVSFDGALWLPIPALPSPAPGTQP